jgi:hypothetical protein
MLAELKGVAQRPGEPKRRWFQSPDEDLIVLYAEDGSILGFQLCYDRQRKERALTWFESKGYSHERVDDGEDVGLAHKQAPILVPDGVFNADVVLERFASASEALPAEVASLVVRKIKEYAEKDT